MKDASKRLPVAEQILKGLEEAIRRQRGEIALKTTVLPSPSEPPEIDAASLAALRGRSGMSVECFARLLNVSPKTLQSWERGVRSPSQTARRLIQIFSEHPEAVCRSVGVPPVGLRGVSIEEVEPGRRRLVVQGVPSKREPRRKPSAPARTKTETSR